MRKIKKSRELELLEEIKKSIDELKKKRYFELGEERYHPYPNPNNPYGYWWNGTIPISMTYATGNAFDEDSNIIQYKFS